MNLLLSSFFVVYKPIFIVLAIITSVVFLALLFALILFLKIFYSKPRKKKDKDYCPLPSDKRYKPYYSKMIEWIKIASTFDHQKYNIISDDGLKLCGKFYKFYDDAPIEIMFHGYRGDSVRDLSGGIIRAKKVGHNILAVDNRASGESEGSVITFGIKEHSDCLKWINFVIDNVEKDAKIILSGVSMGASTVLMASGCKLPKNVIGIIADCGYSSPKEIIKEVIKGMHLPASLIFPFVWLGAKIFGRFNLTEFSPKEALKKTTIPVFFIHGDKDDFVPLYMSEINFESCSSKKKKLVITTNAWHALCYMVNEQEYEKEVIEFFK